VQQRVTAEMLKNTYQGVGPENKLMSEAWKEYNAILLQRVNAKEPTLDLDTQERFVITANKVTAFLKHKYKTADKLLRDLKDSFGDDFFHYLTTEDELCRNTAMKYMKNTKQMLRWAARQGYVKTNPLEDFKCKYKDPKRQRVTLDELIRMYNTKMPVRRLEEVRDIYVFGCFTGYAYMDLYNLTPENVMHWIDGTKWLIKDRHKGDNTKSNVPLMEIPLAIIEKYRNHPYCVNHNKLLPLNSNQRFNSYIKEVAALSGINKELTCHTARHTFATTILIDSGCSTNAAGEMLGHESERTTRIYAKTTDIRVAKDMIEVRNNLTERMQKINTASTLKTAAG
jgi:integrase